MARLNEAQVAQYHEQGYVVPDGRLSADQIDDLKQAHSRLVARHPKYNDYCPNVLAYDLAFLNVARDPIILDCVAQVIGPDIALWNSSLFAKPAHNGRKTPWHQDGEYWPIRPLATCTAWIALDRSTPENGCLRVIKGSHRSRSLARHETNSAPNLTLHQELIADQFDEADAVDIVLEPGQFSLHDIYLYHGSEANVSDHPRRGMTLRYMPTTSVFDRAMARDMAVEKGLVDHSDRTLFLMSGVDRSGENDFRIRL